MKWIEPTVFAKSCGNPDFRSIFGHQRAKNEGTNTKIDRGPETYPISINPRNEMNWANSFREKLRKPCLQTDGRTDRRTDRHQGESSIPPFHLRWSGGITIRIHWTSFDPHYQRMLIYNQTDHIIFCFFIWSPLSAHINSVQFIIKLIISFSASSFNPFISAC